MLRWSEWPSLQNQSSSTGYPSTSTSRTSMRSSPLKSSSTSLSQIASQPMTTTFWLGAPTGKFSFLTGALRFKQLNLLKKARSLLETLSVQLQFTRSGPTMWSLVINRGSLFWLISSSLKNHWKLSKTTTKELQLSIWLSAIGRKTHRKSTSQRLQKMRNLIICM